MTSRLTCLNVCVWSVLLFALVATPTQAQEMQWEDYEPRSTLVVAEHPVTQARYPFVDVHSHQFRAPDMSQAQVDELIADMDAMNMAVMVNLSGGQGDRLARAVTNLKQNHANRFVVFANLDYDGFGTPGWSEQAAAQLEQDVANGAQGLKIYKRLGLDATDHEGNRIAVDDPRLDAVWAKAGELGIPVLIHTADPKPFWEPQDRYNERWFELKERPGRKHMGEPTWEQLIEEQHNVFRKHPETTFINAHLGWYGNDLGTLGRLMDEMPNMYTEVGAVLAELGRQPRTARAFLIKYKDRVLFGKDAWTPEEYHTYFRVFETADEYFDYYRKRHAFWKLYGLDLPDDVLRHIYYRNALAIIPGLDASLFPE